LKIAYRKIVLEKKIRGLKLYKVLIIDEIDYLPFGEDESHCLFQLISNVIDRITTIFA
jgi:DNA replication protein DnaC